MNQDEYQERKRSVIQSLHSPFDDWAELDSWIEKTEQRIERIHELREYLEEVREEIIRDVECDYTAEVMYDLRKSIEVWGIDKLRPILTTRKVELDILIVHRENGCEECVGNEGEK